MWISGLKHNYRLVGWNCSLEADTETDTCQLDIHWRYQKERSRRRRQIARVAQQCLGQLHKCWRSQKSCPEEGYNEWAFALSFYTLAGPNPAQGNQNIT